MKMRGRMKITTGVREGVKRKWEEKKRDSDDRKKDRETDNNKNLWGTKKKTSPS